MNEVYETVMARLVEAVDATQGRDYILKPPSEIDAAQDRVTAALADARDLLAEGSLPRREVAREGATEALRQLLGASQPLAAWAAREAPLRVMARWRLAERMAEQIVGDVRPPGVTELLTLGKVQEATEIMRAESTCPFHPDRPQVRNHLCAECAEMADNAR